MSNLDIIFYVAIGGSLLTIFCKKIFNFFDYSKVEVAEINSADKNISSARVEEIIKAFMNYLGITQDQLKINYETGESYTKIFTMLNRRKKVINIPKWVMPSVGYELDYLLASIWYNAKLFKKDKGIRRMQIIAHTLPLVAGCIYVLALCLAITLLFVKVLIMNEIDFESSFLSIIYKIKILETICLVFYAIYLLCEVNSLQIKFLLESNYERNIVKFVDEELTGYKSDITAARLYAVQIKKMHFDSFRFNSKTSNLKFLGPFVCL
ncbi:transmembrane protein [Spiroplasma clarkii]|uniref:Transmembrane protein n=1 Tax=Spiroplasma clarkii TaxID=2139 RepID=A0A1Y0L230_9MOLU|nr:hypothetical protein [Spiroplasma clarkii]ARU92046.1 transmembrane protein [Spiroplasma clarkii]ATX71373.1 transmembrane protein [Spiroplasma clarkii]